MRPIILTVKMELQRMIKDKYFLFYSLLMPFILYCLFTYMSRGSSVNGIDFDYYFLISMTCYSLVMTSVQTFGIQIMHDRKQTWMNYLFTQPITRPQYFISRIMTQLILNIVIVSLFFFIINLWKQFDRPFSEWMMTSLWLLSGSTLFLTIGILVAQSRKIETASATSNIVVLGLAIVGGLWMPLNSFPVWLQTIGEWLPSYLYAQGAWSIAANQGIDFSNIIIIVCYFLVCFICAMLLQYRKRS
ncbi:ABC transporter permease [Terribacillus saccharophilus]|uniref:ABC transporter permease n=1 Tax=Terribacillus saccharophilus TaxID=361277 RepID=UPI003981B97C